MAWYQPGRWIPIGGIPSVPGSAFRFRLGGCRLARASGGFFRPPEPTRPCRSLPCYGRAGRLLGGSCLCANRIGGQGDGSCKRPSRTWSEAFPCPCRCCVPCCCCLCCCTFWAVPSDASASQRTTSKIQHSSEPSSQHCPGRPQGGGAPCRQAGCRPGRPALRQPPHRHRDSQPVDFTFANLWLVQRV